MTVTSQNRGHIIKHNPKGWVDFKSGERDTEQRLCEKCGQHPTSEGYDPCIAGIINLLNAIPGIETLESCCGHGKSKTWIWFRVKNQVALASLLRKYVDPSKGERVLVEFNETFRKLVYVYEKDVATKTPEKNKKEQ